MTTITAIEQTIHKFLMETTGDIHLDLNTDLLTSGLLDSLTMMDLVVFIEVEFQHRIALDDMRPERFQTISAVAQLVSGMQLRDGKQAA